MSKTTIEEKLNQLPRIAEETGLNANEALKREILARAGDTRKTKNVFVTRIVPVLCALALVLGGVYALLPGRQQSSGVMLMEDAASFVSIPAGESYDAEAAMPALGDSVALDLPVGSITIRSNRDPGYRSVWAAQEGANFPLVGVNGRYYRLLTNPTEITGGLLGENLGTVTSYTSEPALSGKNGICSNTVPAGETVYAVKNMKGAAVAAKVNGKMRVFQRVSFGENAVTGSEKLSDTLKASNAVALEITGVGTVNDKAAAQRLVNILLNNASYIRGGCSETGKTLLIQLENGITLQMSVNGERFMACGTWACPEFMDAFKEAVK